jgi:metal-sulfur cluster biosynthetic enzyme
MANMNDTLPEKIQSQLRKVIDPELGINIVDLGMVRSVRVEGDGRASVSLLLTTPACPLWELFEFQVKAALGETAQVHFVTEPKWTPAMMEKGAREELIQRGMINPGWVGVEIAKEAPIHDRSARS